MCGICGIAYVYHHRSVETATLESMMVALIHRGPEETGILQSRGVGLGMRRLKIIDLTTGSQPVYNEDETIGVVFNGEIYNFQEIRRELEAEGHRFRTHSDTEVIVHAYEAYGIDCATHFNGMFAFALWDARTRRLFLARDRAGQKPLFYHLNADRLLFASEIKALLQAGDIPVEVNPEAIYHYLSLQYVPGPQTILKGVSQLPAGHVAVWKDGILTVSRYWQPEYEPKRQQSGQDWEVETKATITAAVKRHLISDVPLGAFLSGGVDSSVIVGLMAQLSHQQVKTFSIGFDVTEYNELDHARRVAQRFNTSHHEFIVSAREVTDALPEVVWYADQPLADTSALATYQLSRLTRQFVTVALTGDGGDEAFAGYTRYWLDRWLAVYRLLPRSIRQRIIPRLATYLRENSDIPTDRNIVAGVRRLAQASTTSSKASILGWGSFFSSEQKLGLASPGWLRLAAASDTTALLEDSYDRASAQSHLDRTLSVDFLMYLADDLLVKADRMAMAHSLETRSPLLDNEVLALAQHMPDDLRIRGRTQKWIFRQTFADLLPQENVQRIKRGFGMPVSSWLRGHMQPFAREILLSNQSLSRGYFVPDRVRQLLDAHCSGQADHGQRLWALLVLELWHQAIVDKSLTLRNTNSLQPVPT